jgi:two-component system, cell cycle sensor histidine kinase and response regulator CckA
MRVAFPVDKHGKKPANSANQSLPFGGSETLLVAEDEPLVAKITKETLQKAGYTVLVASNGKEAIELLSSNDSVSLVFLDVVMPQMGGPEAALIIKKSYPELPILFATGYAPSSDTVIPNGHIVLNKPYRGDELLNNVRTLLDGLSRK